MPFPSNQKFNAGIPLEVSSRYVNERSVAFMNIGLGLADDQVSNRKCVSAMAETYPSINESKDLARIRIRLRDFLNGSWAINFAIEIHVFLGRILGTPLQEVFHVRCNKLLNCRFWEYTLREDLVNNSSNLFIV